MSLLKDKQDNSETQLLLLKILNENFKSFLSPQTLNKSIWRVILMAFTLNSKLDHDSSFVIRVIAAHTYQGGGTRFAPDYLVLPHSSLQILNLKVCKKYINKYTMNITNNNR